MVRDFLGSFSPVESSFSQEALSIEGLLSIEPTISGEWSYTVLV